MNKTFEYNREPTRPVLAIDNHNYSANTSYQLPGVSQGNSENMLPAVTERGFSNKKIKYLL
jgi:hypothetical protein